MSTHCDASQKGRWSLVRRVGGGCPIRNQLSGISTLQCYRCAVGISRNSCTKFIVRWRKDSNNLLSYGRCGSVDDLRLVKNDGRGTRYDTTQRNVLWKRSRTTRQQRKHPNTIDADHPGFQVVPGIRKCVCSRHSLVSKVKRMWLKENKQYYWLSWQTCRWLDYFILHIINTAQK